MTFGFLGLVLLTRPAVFADISLAGGRIGNTGGCGVVRVGPGSPLRAETGSETGSLTTLAVFGRHDRDAHFSNGTFRGMSAIIDEILVLRVFLHYDQSPDLSEIPNQINRLVPAKFVHFENSMRLVSGDVEIIFENVDARRLIAFFVEALDDFSAGAV